VKAFEIGPGLKCDADRLVASRLLVQANSGGGKTRTLRRLLEQSHGKLQHLVIDPEGEYHTLREKFDYVLAAPTGGDTVAHPRTAAMLAERLLQLNVSAILDIYELNPDQRVLFVQRFLDALVNAPRDLWHPALIVLDEAHVYAPEGKENASTAAVKAMASRGRKRGFCLVPATQRLAKLSKDVAAECNNKLIGRCTLDVDIKRAAEELGFTTNEQKQGLRQLEPGQFYAYGPAFDVTTPMLVRVGPVKSHHPEPGQKAAPVPAPTEKVKKVLQQLADLPAEAEERERSISELRKDNADKARRIKQLEAERAKATPNIPVNIPAARPVPALTDADRKSIEKLVAAYQSSVNGAREALAGAEQRIRDGVRVALDEHLASLRAATADILTEIERRADQPSVKKLLEKLNGLAVVPRSVVPAPIRQVTAPRGSNNRTGSTSIAPVQGPRPDAAQGLQEPEQRILDSLAWWKAAGIERPTRVQVAFGARYTLNGHVNNTLGGLRTKGLIDYPDRGAVSLTEAGAALANTPSVAADRDELIRRALEVLREEPQQRLFRALVSAEAEMLTREELAHACNYTLNGHVNNTLGSLRSIGLIDYPRRGFVALSEMFNV